MTRGKAKQLRALIEQLSALLDDETALDGVELFPMWNAEKEYATGDRVQYDGTLYKCLTAHTAQGMWTPVDAPSLWAKVLIPDENEIPVWEQPLSTNPYNKGDKVMYNGVVWMSTIDGNVWQPGVYGWQEV